MKCAVCLEGQVIKELQGVISTEYCDSCGSLQQSPETIRENIRMIHIIAPFNEIDQPWTEEKIQEFNRVLDMYETDPSFIEQCMSGGAFAEDIDNFVELWHTSEAGHGLTLSQYLGFTAEEYARWMKDASTLLDILQERIEKNA